MKICLPLAVRHAARLRFTRDSTDIDFIAIDDDRLMLRVSAHGIMLSNDVPETLSRALTSKLDLPLIVPAPAREPLDLSEPRSLTPKAGADQVANPNQDHGETLPRPRRLILDSGGLTDPEELAGEKVFTISSPRGELAGFDLSELQHLTYVTANKLDPAVPRIAEDLRAQALSRGMPPDLDVELYMPEVVFEDAPRVLVLVFDPDDEMRRGPHPDHPDTLLIPVWTAAVADYVGIEVHNIEMVVFHFQESGDAPSQDTVDSVNALRAGLEASLQPPLLDETPQFIESYGDCADAPWPSPFDDVDNDVDFSP